MPYLSGCILEWDSEDYDLGMSAKKDEMICADIPDPQESAIRKAITKDVSARTRGVEKISQLIEVLFLSLSTATDTLGMPIRLQIKSASKTMSLKKTVRIKESSLGSQNSWQIKVLTFHIRSNSRDDD